MTSQNAEKSDKRALDGREDTSEQATEDVGEAFDGAAGLDPIPCDARDRAPRPRARRLKKAQ